MKCRFEHDEDCCNSGATQYMCKCKQPCDTIVPMTNADRIRAMSDEELTDAWIRDNTICHRCAYWGECEFDEFVTNEKCREGILEWHKQPADMRGEEE